MVPERKLGSGLPRRWHRAADHLLLRLWRLDRSVEALRGPAEQLSHRDISAVRCQWSGRAAAVHRPLARGHMDGLTRPRSKYRESSVWCAWAAAAEPQRRNAVTCPEEMTKSAKCPPESATVRGSWGGMGCPRVRAIESNLAEGKRIWEFLAFEACPRPETHWNLSAESGDEILFL